MYRTVPIIHILNIYIEIMINTLSLYSCDDKIVIDFVNVFD